ncbi:MAG: glutathione S-transferase [Asticcacaulis sp.]|uniref:glutathione S-transferase family protein n=1 Tax=Asticcacaulis sp. TaxID=1872648 RepID=UPI0039E225F4
MLRILGRVSSLNVRKVLWTCDELGLAYEREDYGIGFAPVDTPSFLTLNPNAQVPVLIEDDFVLWESNAICRYLATGSPLLPENRQSRAFVEQWMDWQATELNPAWRYAFLGLHWRYPDYQDSERIEASIRAWNDKMALLDVQLARTDAWVTGDTFTLADIVLGISANRWLRTPIPRPDLPAVSDWHSRLCQRKAFLTYGPNGTV